MNKAFLSHSSSDKDFVRKVYKEVGAARCIFDECCFENGKSIIDEIVKGISNTDLFVLFISNDSLNSEWVQKEIILADNFVNAHEKKMILPILIDSGIKPDKDSRIPEWMKAYLMKPCHKEYTAASMIREALRELEYLTNPTYAAKRNLFIGRYREREEMEEALEQSIDPHYRSIIVNGLEGVGRRTLLMHFLQDRALINEHKEPICVRISTRSTIDDLILRLIEIVNGCVTPADFESLNTKTISEKSEFLKSYFEQLIKDHIYLFIIDDGCIVRPSQRICGWFVEAIDIPELLDSFNISIISKYRPSIDTLNHNDDLLCINVSPLSESETRTLFNKYCKILNVRSADGMDDIRDSLNGLPSQVYYAVEMIQRCGLDMALRNKQLIVDSGEKTVKTIIQEIKKRGDDSFNLFNLLCTLESTSYKMIYKIAGDTEFVNVELDYFFALGVFSLYGGCKQYIIVNSAIADYIKRSRISLFDAHQTKLDDIVENLVDINLNDTEFSDLSILIHSIKHSIMNGNNLPSSYYLPSFTLDAISDMYNQERYEDVVDIIDRMLLNKKRFDDNTIREYTHWLCISLARLKSTRFEKEVEYFSCNAEYYFLYGFYYRMLHRLERSKEYLREALHINKEHQRSKRELVNVYIMNDEYVKGLVLAKENYMTRSINPFHIQAYFICLVHANLDNIQSVRKELEELILQMKESLDRRAKSMLTTMQGEYEYYVNNDKLKAIKILKDANTKELSNQYAAKALKNIYKREGMEEEYQEIDALLKRFA